MVRMWKRVRQVGLAWRARITPEDRSFIGEYLYSREQELFYGMSVQDQFHCRRVAADILRLAEEHGAMDRRFLVRCALLHDVGRRNGDISTGDKIFTVLLHCLLPEQAIRWGRQGKGTRLDNMRHAVFVYFHHPELGVLLLSKISPENELLGIVGAHHRRADADDPVELHLLRQADELN